MLQDRLLSVEACMVTTQARALQAAPHAQTHAAFVASRHTHTACQAQRGLDPASSKPHLLCFGCGFLGRAVMRAAVEQGWRCTGTQRSPAGDLWPGSSVVRFDSAHPVECVASNGAVLQSLSVEPVRETSLCASLGWSCALQRIARSMLCHWLVQGRTRQICDPHTRYHTSNFGGKRRCNCLG